MPPPPSSPDRATSIPGIVLDHVLGPDARRTPEMQAIRDKLNADAGGLPHWRTLSPAEGRAQSARFGRRWVETLPPVASVTPLTIPAADRTPEVPAELIEPYETEPGCIIYFHGGGWAFSDPGLHQGLTRRLASAAGVRVLSVDYRLAPEHPFPAPLDDCVAAWRWLFEKSATHAPLHGALAVAGDSAGANLALGLLLHEKREGKPLADAGLLFYGAYGADPDTPSSRRFADGYGLARADMIQFWDWYATPEQRLDPVVCPLRAADADLARLPPLFLNAAGLDPLLSDTIQLVERLHALGASYEFVLHEGIEHGFMRMSDALPVADRAIAQAGGFFRDRTAHYGL